MDSFPGRAGQKKAMEKTPREFKFWQSIEAGLAVIPVVANANIQKMGHLGPLGKHTGLLRLQLEF